MINFKGKQIFDSTVFQDKMSIFTPSIIEGFNTTNKEYVDSIIVAGLTQLGYWVDDFTVAVNPVNANSIGLATDQPITGFPNELVKIKLNGINQILGNKSAGDCYFSRDGGFSAVAQADKGDNLYWNGPLSGVPLDTNDNIDIIYVTGIEKRPFTGEIEYIFNGRGNIFVLDDVSLVPNQNKIIINGVDIWLAADLTSLFWDTTAENYEFDTQYTTILRTYNDLDFNITYDGPVLNTLGQVVGQQFTVEEQINVTVSFSTAFNQFNNGTNWNL